MTEARSIPARLSSFIGRKKEIAELRRLSAHTRVMTILGPGGAGKTRLAMEFARQQQDRFADGAVLVELAEVWDGSLVADAIARAARITVQGEDAQAALGRRLAGKHILLVIDNCEHLVRPVAEVVGRLLRECDRVSVLATSRERLNIEGETSWRLPPMKLPETADPAGSAASTDAVRLFVDRARSGRPGFDIDAGNATSVVAICRRLDGMPLAIELAAARVATLTPGEIMARLDDRLRFLIGGSRTAPDRLQTMRATLDWSYELLDADERTLLQRLSVFAGAFRLDSAEEVCGFAPLRRDGVVDGITGLTDKSVIQAEPDAGARMRYRLLETVREYAAQKLEMAGGAEELRDRHLAFYQRRAEEAYEARLTRGALPEHRLLWAEITDVRVALERSGRDRQELIHLLGSLRYVWMIFAPAEGTERLRKALLPLDLAPTLGLVRALWVWQALTGRGGQVDDALVSPTQLAKMAEEVGDHRLAPTVHLGHAYIAERIEGDAGKAREAMAKAIPELEAAGNRPDLAMALASMGCFEMQLGGLDAAGPWIDRALAVAREAEDDYGVIGALYTRGWLETLAGDSERARRTFLEALELTEENDLLSVAQQVEGIAANMPDARAALTLFGGAAKLRQELLAPVHRPWSIWMEPAIAAARDGLPEDVAASAWGAGNGLTPPQLLSKAGAAVGGEELPKSGALKGAGGLIRRERQVAELVAGGSSNKEIAERLFLSERTVESHVDHILGKLNFNSRVRVSGWVAEQRLAEDGSA
jgi:predicted ATPase/DNA-binding CsgD family transcriptional regulator